MIFMHIESGELYEMLIMSLNDDKMVFTADGVSRYAYGIGEFTLLNPNEKQIRKCLVSEFASTFEFIGVL
jgi:hypothetical protein